MRFVAHSNVAAPMPQGVGREVVGNFPVPTPQILIRQSAPTTQKAHQNAIVPENIERSRPSVAGQLGGQSVAGGVSGMGACPSTVSDVGFSDSARVAFLRRVEFWQHRSSSTFRLGIIRIHDCDGKSRESRARKACSQFTGKWRDCCLGCGHRLCRGVLTAATEVDRVHVS